MYIRKNVEVHLDPQDKEILTQANDILKRICDACEDCDECPLNHTCSCTTRPYLITEPLLKKYEKTLDK